MKFVFNRIWQCLYVIAQYFRSSFLCVRCYYSMRFFFSSHWSAFFFFSRHSFLFMARDLIQGICEYEHSWSIHCEFFCIVVTRPFIVMKCVLRFVLQTKSEWTKYSIESRLSTHKWNRIYKFRTKHLSEKNQIIITTMMLAKPNSPIFSLYSVGEWILSTKK